MRSCGGDYDTAEQRYTQSLKIEERLGNQAGLAISCATLAVLMTERGKDEDAIAYDLRALAIGQKMRDQHAATSVDRLAQAKSRLGNTAFAAIAARFVDEGSLDQLVQLLDRAPPPDEDAAAEAPDP